MTKAVFLEYKFGDYDTKTLYTSGANEGVAWMERLNTKRLQQLWDWKVKITLAFSAFTDDDCPFSPNSRIRLENLLKQAVNHRPNGIILDHFRFWGKWEQSEEKLKYVPTHQTCTYCKGKNKGFELAKITDQIKKIVPKNVELGYYAVPFDYDKFSQFGQNHALLGKLFDYISPMLYHRMLDKPVEYVHEFTQYLVDLTGKPVIPTIAVKDMPDDLTNQVDESILKEEYAQAIKSPSTGVCWFSWDGAVEMNKTGIIAKIWK